MASLDLIPYIWYYRIKNGQIKSLPKRKEMKNEEKKAKKVLILVITASFDYDVACVDTECQRSSTA